MGQSLNSFISGIEFLESEIVVASVFFPFGGDFSTSPHPNSLNLVVFFNSVDSQNSESIFSEVLKLLKISVFKIVGQISYNSFA